MKALYVLALLCLTVTTTLAASAATTTTDVNYINIADGSMAKQMMAMKEDPQTHKKALGYINPNKHERNQAMSHMNHVVSRIPDFGHKGFGPQWRLDNSTEKILLDIDEVFLWFNVAELILASPFIITGVLEFIGLLLPEFGVPFNVFLIVTAVVFFIVYEVLMDIPILDLFLLPFIIPTIVYFGYFIVLFLLSMYTFPYEAIMLFLLVTNYGPYSLVQKKSKNVCTSKHHQVKDKVESLWAKKDYAGIGKQLCTMRPMSKKLAKKTKQDKADTREKGKHHQTVLHKMCGEVVKATHESTDDLVKGLDLHGFDSKSTFCENKLVSSYSF